MSPLDFSSDEYFMGKAMKQAVCAFDADEVPVGAVIVHDGKIIAQAHNQVEQLKDPTAHAEMLAITQATAALSCKWLEKCTLYVTIEPCSMCAGALILARIPKVVYGAADPKTGAFGSKLNINDLQLNHTIDVVKGVLENDCRTIVQEFFRAKRG